MGNAKSYNLTYSVTRNGEAMTIKGRVSFSHDPEQYGNGYGMYIQTPEEAFGGQGYDIRYNRDFDPENMIGFIVNWFAARYNGKGQRWTLTGIRVYERED